MLWMLFRLACLIACANVAVAAGAGGFSFKRTRATAAIGIPAVGQLLTQKRRAGVAAVALGVLLAKLESDRHGPHAGSTLPRAVELRTDGNYRRAFIDRQGVLFGWRLCSVPSWPDRADATRQRRSGHFHRQEADRAWFEHSLGAGRTSGVVDACDRCGAA